MSELAQLLKPTWGAEQWILEGWNQINSDEKELIKGRMDELFSNGLPFELKSDKLAYIYTFSLLAQLEVLAIQIPLKFEAKMSTVEHRKRMRLQLLDEIFHGLVFTKIVYMLSSPYASPPEYNPNIELLCNFIRNEECPKVAVMLLNLIGEGWIEEIFCSLHRCGVAPKVFETILEDEHRHVCEADLYRDIGMPHSEEIKPKVAFLEEQLISNVLMQYKYMMSICTLLGAEGMQDFNRSLNEKHIQQLKKVQLQPGKQWKAFMSFGEGLLPKMQEYAASQEEVEMTSIRKVFMTQWGNPNDPTMVGQFNVNISCLDFFNKKFPPETITCLMLQALSLGLSSTDSFRNYLNLRKMFRSKEAYVGLVVKLPECGDHIGTIVFENCHELSLATLSAKIRALIKMMAYCYKKREYLEKNDPRVQKLMGEMVYEFAYSTYPYPFLGTPFVSLSNIGFCGYSQCKSPLRNNEVMKMTLMEVERRPVWQEESQSFQPEDILPVSISADHRVFDGNLPIPKMVNQYFKEIFNKMLKEESLPVTSIPESNVAKILDSLITTNVEVAYKTLLFLQTYWCDFLSLEELVEI